jgi:hypothetical protein
VSKSRDRRVTITRDDLFCIVRFHSCEIRISMLHVACRRDHRLRNATARLHSSWLMVLVKEVEVPVRQLLAAPSTFTEEYPSIARR